MAAAGCAGARSKEKMGHSNRSCAQLRTGWRCSFCWFHGGAAGPKSGAVTWGCGLGPYCSAKESPASQRATRRRPHEQSQTLSRAIKSAVGCTLVEEIKLLNRRPGTPLAESTGRRRDRGAGTGRCLVGGLRLRLLSLMGAHGISLGRGARALSTRGRSHEPTGPTPCKRRTACQGFATGAHGPIGKRARTQPSGRLHIRFACVFRILEQTHDAEGSQAGDLEAGEAIPIRARSASRTAGWPRATYYLFHCAPGHQAARLWPDPCHSVARSIRAHERIGGFLGRPSPNLHGRATHTFVVSPTGMGQSPAGMGAPAAVGMAAKGGMRHDWQQACHPRAKFKIA